MWPETARGSVWWSRLRWLPGSVSAGWLPPSGPGSCTRRCRPRGDREPSCHFRHPGWRAGTHFSGRHQGRSAISTIRIRFIPAKAQKASGRWGSCRLPEHAGGVADCFEAVGGRPVPETLLVAAARLPEVPALGERDGGCAIQVDRASRRRSEAVTGRRRHANTRWVARSFPLREGPAIAAKGISVRRRAPLRDSRLREVR